MATFLDRWSVRWLSPPAAVPLLVDPGVVPLLAEGCSHAAGHRQPRLL